MLIIINKWRQELYKNIKEINIVDDFAEEQTLIQKP